MRFPRIRRFSGWVACCLCMLIPVLVGCGDYCLFCEGQGSGGGGGGDGDEEICDNFFSGLAGYQAALNIKTIHSFTEERTANDRLSLAVLPKGMSFEYGSNRTADPGDVIVADQQATDVFYVYEYSTTTQTQRSFDVGVDQISGVALLHQEIDQTTDADLLLFTVEAQDTLYIYDLTGTTIPSTLDNPHPITNSDVDDVFTEPGDFFEFPTAIAVSADSEEAVVFILNDNGNDSSVRRLRLNLDSLDPISAKTIGTKAVITRPLMDIAFFDETDALFVSKKTVNETLSVGWVYRITDASDRTSSVNLDSAPHFIQAEPGLFTGLATAFTNLQGTTADLLVLREGEGSVEQYDTLGQGAFETAFSFGTPAPFPQAVAYDCTNERLVLTNIPFDPLDNERRLLEALPTQ